MGSSRENRLEPGDDNDASTHYGMVSDLNFLALLANCNTTFQLPHDLSRAAVLVAGFPHSLPPALTSFAFDTSTLMLALVCEHVSDSEFKRTHN